MNQTKIFKDYAEFLNREDKTVNGVSVEFAVENPDYETDNATNTGCWNCLNCVNCRYCDDCFNCNSTPPF